MVIPQFIRFYPGYQTTDVLGMYAVTFWALVNAMFRIKAEEQIDRIGEVALGMSDPNSRNEAISNLQKSSRGVHGIVEEVRIVKQSRRQR